MYKRIIVKIGTGVISLKDGGLDSAVLEQLVEQVSALRKREIEVIVVTSGAVGTGRGLIKLNGADSVVEKQVFAAVGQVKLMSMYAEYFAKRGFVCAQVLATKEDFRDKEHYQNMKNCMQNLLQDNVVPVVNENDVVAVAELVFTDNDELAGLIAEQLDVDAVIILTSVDGVFRGDPSKSDSQLISEIECREIDNYEKFITTDKSKDGRGGMSTKFAVAKNLCKKGIAVHIANGHNTDVLKDILRGVQVGTKFVPAER